MSYVLAIGFVTDVLFYRTIVDDVHSKIGGGGGGGGGMDMQLLSHELRDNLNSVKQDVAKILSKPPGVSIV
jgi:hypothetical protein